MTVPGIATLEDDDPSVLGPYALLGRLGDGGMGTVYLGRAASGKLVAVKVVRREHARHPEFRERFLREAHSARRVARFCTAEVLDVDTEGSRPYLVTEFIDGPTLAAVVRERGPMPTAELERLAVAVASALTAIHAAGLVHRDLKPANILLSSSGARVIDFGIARALDAATTALPGRPGMGTPAFMAPEQALGRKVTEAADVHAWGGVVLFAGTGRMPYGDGPGPAVLYRAVHEQPDLTGLDGGLRVLVEEALSKDPRRRPSAPNLLLRLMGGRDSVGPLVPRPRPGAPMPVADTRADVDVDARIDADARVDHRADTDARAVEDGPGGSADRSPGTPRPERDAGRSPAPASQGDQTGRSAGTRGAARSAAGTSGTGRMRAPVWSPDPRWLVPLALIVAACLVAGLILPGGSDPPPGGLPDTRRSGVLSLAFAPGGELLATAGADETVRLWHTGGPGAPRPAGVIPGHHGGAWAVVFSPAVPSLLVTGSGDGSLRTWDVTDPGRPRALGEPITGIFRSLRSLAFAPDGRLLAGGGADGAVRLWDMSEPGAPHAPGAALASARSSVRSLAFAPDGLLLATRGPGDTAVLWDVTLPQAPRLAGPPLAGPVGEVLSLAFAPDGRTLATGSTDDAVQLWDVTRPEAARAVGTPLTGSSGDVLALAFAPDGRTLAAGGAGDTVQLWDVTRPPAAHPLGPPLAAKESAEVGRGAADRRGDGDVVALAFSPDGTTLAAGGTDGSARLWQVGG